MEHADSVGTMERIIEHNRKVDEKENTNTNNNLVARQIPLDKDDDKCCAIDKKKEDEMINDLRIRVRRIEEVKKTNQLRIQKELDEEAELNNEKNAKANQAFESKNITFND